jgi:hypothetical protein
MATAEMEKHNSVPTYLPKILGDTFSNLVEDRIYYILEREYRLVLPQTFSRRKTDLPNQNLIVISYYQNPYTKTTVRIWDSPWNLPLLLCESEE